MVEHIQQHLQRTPVMIRVPPGAPSASTSSPSRRTIVGHMPVMRAFDRVR